MILSQGYVVCPMHMNISAASKALSAFESVLRRLMKPQTHVSWILSLSSNEQED